MGKENTNHNSRVIPSSELSPVFAQRLVQLGIRTAPALYSAIFTGPGEVSTALGITPEEFVKMGHKATGYISPDDVTRIGFLAQDKRSEELAGLLAELERKPDVVLLQNGRRHT